MGWTSYHTTKEDLLAAQFADFAKHGYNILKKRTIGRTTWVVYECKELDENGKRIVKIELILTDKFGEDEWGYKLISECMGPSYYNCPTAFLKMSTDMREGSVNWRNACIANADLRKIKAVKLAVGTEFMIEGGVIMQVVGYHTGTKYKYLVKGTGSTFRCSHDYIMRGIDMLRMNRTVESAQTV